MKQWKKLNLGILAHVDAGKTSLTERLLHHTGAISAVGSVDAGTTQTDSMDLERRRGITIRSAVATFTLGDLKVNLIDTPGHSDFIAEVERVLGVLDGVVLVVSAVEGVQPQTRVLMRTLRRLGTPVLFFVNKVDRMGARDRGVVREIRDRLAPAAPVLSTVAGAGTARARVARRELADSRDPGFATELAEVLTAQDDAFLARYIEGLEGGPALGEKEYVAELAAQTARGAVHPVFFGSALTGEGVPELIEGVRELLPTVAPQEAARPLLGSVFKVERGARGEMVAYARLRSGTLGAREHVTLRRADRSGRTTEHPGRITALGVFEHGPTSGGAARETRAAAGDIVRIWGLKGVRIGDRVVSAGADRDEDPADSTPPRMFFAAPSLETVVRPVLPAEKGRLHTALRMLGEQDPSIEVRSDEDSADGAVVRLYGEVQKEILAATLEESFGVRACFDVTRTVCIEKPAGAGEALEELDTRTRNYFWATVGLRVEPGEPGSGVSFGLSVELGSLPLAFHKAIEESVHSTLRYGVYGWQVTDVKVTLVRTGFASPVSAADDFRKVTPLVVMRALQEAGTEVHEPVSAFELELPAARLSPVLAKLAELGAIPAAPSPLGDVYHLPGTLPTQRVHEFQQVVPGLTNGEGVFTAEPHGHRPTTAAAVPERPRPAGPDPRNRDAYILHVLKNL
ncbi:elongation factor G [Streptomyces halobius]|uniref:TetM/TetW/TetO/TetS family tetracycline resistance ribosomal protection protein n=1 Tax=Streptomyces halobius TaxID=2879846 RepID=A0ABY4M5Q4_9ACTN|nr:TetM/TetW/TetO/TetS family tetracycline resistance ribosomal protection protein [Streptomyces halobius]UQA92613.1 TetM/TetW/TetO/TetS family tetracycline resistance ribosomal protection protein [Streptomyces halobius]